MASQAAPQAALYYPHAEFASAAWVKAALLYWERMGRLIGRGPPSDDPEIRQLVDAGLIEDIESEPYRAAAVRALGDYVDNIVRECGDLPASIPPIREVRGRSREEVASLREEVVRGLEADGRTSAARVLRARPEQCSSLYATIGSGVIAEERGLAPTTDDPVFTALATMWKTRVTRERPTEPEETRERHTETEAEVMAATEIMVPIPSLEDIHSLSVERLLEIRNKTSKSRRSFREAVEGRSRAIAGLPTVYAMKKQLQVFAEQIMDDLNDQQDALKTSKAERRWSVMRVTAPVTAAAMLAGAATSPIAAPVAGAGVVALGVTGWFLHRRPGHGEPGPHHTFELERAIGSDAGGGLRAGFEKLFSR